MPDSTASPDPLRAAIAADCPHRLHDYDRHLDGRQPTAAFIQLWREEHAISRDPAIEQQLNDLYRQAENSATPGEAKAYLEQTSRIRYEIRAALDTTA